MYVILVYDFGEKRVGKMLKLCRKYLNWIQNSVFEGEISEVKLKELTIERKGNNEYRGGQHHHLQQSHRLLHGQTSGGKRKDETRHILMKKVVDDHKMNKKT
jgi:hypothetical protein